MRHPTKPRLAAATFAIWASAAATVLISRSAAAGLPQDADHNMALLRSDIERGTASGYSASNCGNVNNVPTSKPARVLTNPNLAAILWNSSVWSELQTNAPLFYSDLEQAGSSYLPSLFNDYGVSTGSYRGIFTITPKTYNTGTKCTGGVCTITESDINTELSYQITNNASGIPTPEGDGVDGKGFAKNLLYLVHLPANYVLKDLNGNPQCGFHDQMKDNAGNTVSVAYMADMSPGSTCSGQQAWTGLGPIMDTSQMASHEIGEAAVNPFPQTKYNGEIGDRCQCNLYYTGFPGIGGTAAWTTFAGSSRTWVVQQPYMLSTKSCQTMQLAPPAAQNANNSSTFAVAATSGTIGEVWSPIAGTLDAASWSSSTGWTNQIVYIAGAIVAGSQIAAVSKDAANFYAFYIGVDGNLWVSWFSSAGWQHFAVTGLVESHRRQLSCTAWRRCLGRHHGYWQSFRVLR